MSDTSPGSLRVALQFHIFLVPGFYSVYVMPMTMHLVPSLMLRWRIITTSSSFPLTFVVCHAALEQTTHIRKETNFFVGGLYRTNKNLT